jgi:hypothetical protein
MKAIQRRIRRERALNIALAEWAALLLRKNAGHQLAPDQLEELQERNRTWRQLTADQRGELKRRRRQRSARIKSRFGSTEAVHQARLDHDQSLNALDGMLAQRESILYQTGDACAWYVMGGQTRLLVPLFNDGKVNTLPPGVGLSGPAYLAKQAHATGNFLVIHNDLTRCMGTGDLTVVWAKQQWHHPAVFEVKTTASDDQGRSTINLLGIQGGFPADVELVRDFQAQLGFEVKEEWPLDDRAERQVKEIESRAELMQDITAGGVKALSADGRTLWKGVEGLLRAALRNGSSYGEVEPGVHMIAVRNGETDRFEESFRAAFSRFKDEVMSLTPEMEWGTAATSELATQAPGAPLVAPLLLWRIDPDLAARLAANELVLIGYVRKDVWPTVFAERGIVREIDEEGNWLLRRGDALVTFSNVVAAKITAGVIFSGISPIAVAAAVDTDLTAQMAAPKEPAAAP